MPQWINIVCNVLFNACMGLVMFEIVPDASGTKRWLLFGAWLVGGVAALFGKPVVAFSKQVPPAALALLAPVFFVAACACWQPQSPKYSSPECAVARGAVDCGVAAIGSAIGPILGAIGPGDYQLMLDTAKGQGIAAGGCFLAEVVGAFTAPAAPPEGAKMKASSPVMRIAAEQALAEWRKANKLDAVPLCFRAADGSKVCR